MVCPAKDDQVAAGLDVQDTDGEMVARDAAGETPRRPVDVLERFRQRRMPRSS